ncbi:MAG: EamA family transporter [Clostridia bacterium]|nr:EamA family transporter [Clostridia bacterium]
MILLFFVLCILSSGFTGNIYKKLADESRSLTSSILMPPFWYLMLAVLFGIMAMLEKNAAPAAVLPAILGGVGMFTAACILIESMKYGGFSIPIIIINLNFIIPVILSSFFLNEKAAAIQVIGMVTSVAVIVLLNLRPNPNQDKVNLRKSLILAVGACIANGLVNFFIKINDNAGGSQNVFFAILYLSAAVCGVLLALLVTAVKKEKFHISGAVNKITVPWLLLLGVCNGICFYMTGLIAGHMNAAAQFTIVTAASILLSLAVGILFQHEKLTWKVAVSFILCLFAVGCQAFTLL